MASALADQNLSVPHNECCDDALHGWRRALARGARTIGSTQTGRTKASAVVALGEAMSKSTAAASYFNFKICGGVKIRLSSTGGFQLLSHKHGAVLNEIAMFGSKSRREVAVNIQLPDDDATSEYRDNNF